jgi:alpha-glucosidase
MPSLIAHIGKRLALAACLLATFLGTAWTTAPAQTLARPGWVGSGLNTDPWWQHAIFYQISSPNPDFKDVVTKLDSLRSLGVDAILLPAPEIPTQNQNQPAASGAPTPTLDDFDDLILQGSRAGIRILVSLPASSATPDLARFWLNRGVAGLRIVPTPDANPQETQTLVQTLRKLTAGVVGQRIVLSSYDPTPTASQPARQPMRRVAATPAPRSSDSATAQLLVDSSLSALGQLDAPTLRSLLSQSLTQPNLLLQFQAPTPAPGSPDPYPALAHVIAAILLTTHSAALIDSSENLVLKPAEPPAPEPTPPPAAPPQPSSGFSTFTLVVPHPKPPAPKPPTPAMLAALALTDWYKQLAVLHHGNAAFRSGSITMLNFDQQNALVWVARPPTVSTLTPPVVVLCNLSSSPVTLALGSAINNLNLRGHYLHTLLRSDNAMGAQDIDAVALSPFSVYIGELRR